MNTWWSTKCVSDLALPNASTILPTVSCKKAVEIMETNGYDQLPVVDSDDHIKGVVTNGNLLSKLSSGRVKANDPVSKGMFQKFHRVTMLTSLVMLAEIFDNEFFALVANDEGKIVSITTRIDLLNFLTSKKQ